MSTSVTSRMSGARLCCRLASPFRGVIIALANKVLFVTIAFRAANLGDDYISWGITVSLLIGRVTTVLQATDFRLVQGSVNTNGLGTLLSGFAERCPR